MLPHRWSRAAVLAVIALLSSLLLVAAPQGAEAAGRGIVRGSIVFPHKDSPKVQVLYFDRNWTYLGRRNANGDSYSLTLAPGTYHLQLVDQSPSYDVRKYAPTDVTVTVKADDLTVRNVRMTTGAYLTGTVSNGDRKPASGVRVVAANRQENSFETTANSKGQFALGGLPRGSYSIFTWDKKKKWVAKSTYAGSLRPSRGKNFSIRLNRRAGNMTAYVFTPDGLLPGSTTVTVTSKSTGQWWTSKLRSGTVNFRGLYPGRYTLKFDGLGVWLPATLTVQQANVRGGKSTFGKVRLTKRGAWITGRLMDGASPASALKPQNSQQGAQVMLFNKAGTLLDSTYSSASGYFKLDGQIYTQSGMTIVVDPSNSSSGYMFGASSTVPCRFSRTTRSDVQVIVGAETALGGVSVTRTAGQGGDCATS